LKLLSSADAFVLSSIGVGEASPVAVMEAMSSGLPCICSIIGGTPDMIDDGVDGVLVAQKDVSQIETSIRKLCTDLSFRKQIGANAVLKAKRQFDSHMTSKKLIDTISSHLKTQRAAA
jgi:glycosyltransferase involved in cell wall biosynthesis